ncbi:MAG TPA: hypothetical protein ENK75_01170 [Saprospiraceae bacterium]|nr:hypothetical protein [Saprospiraceae bacterium]
MSQSIDWKAVKESKGFILSTDELKILIDKLIDSSINIFNNETFTTPELIVNFEESIFLKHTLIIRLKKVDTNFLIDLDIQYENGHTRGGVVIGRNIKTLQEIRENINIVEVQKELRELYYSHFDEIDRDW